MEGTMAVVTCFAADFAPRTWAFCSGQTLAIAQNQALFSLLGTTYGGNGVTTFMLPDLRNRTMISPGQGPGLANYALGQTGGNNNVTLLISNLPSHNHNGNVQVSLRCTSTAGGETSPDGMYPALTNQAYGSSAAPGVTMAAPTYSTVLQNAGSNIPISVTQPYLGMNYIICLTGIFPSRN